MKRKIVSALLLTALLAGCVSCGNDTGGTTDSTNEKVPGNDMSDTGMSDEVTTEEYVYPPLDLDGAVLTILNPTTTWGFYTDIDREEQTGDALGDAIYERNRRLEEKYNFTLDVVEENMYSIEAKVRNSVMADDSAFDIVLGSSKLNVSMISDGLVCDLCDIPELNLDRPWWDQSVVNEATINGSLYFALCDITMFSFECTWATYFNKDILEKNQLDTPYELVRSGAWTFDKLGEYTKVCVSLNSDESFTWSADGSSVYGLVSYYEFGHTGIIACGERYITNDADGTPCFSLEGDRFYNVVSKLASLFGRSGEYLSINNDSPNNYFSAFSSSRAAFMAGEIKEIQNLRSVNMDFGIVPLPKYDEEQKDYCSPVTSVVPVCMIPVTNTDTAITGTVLDALAYESCINVLPVFYEINLSQKGLRDDDSIEMLGLIRDDRIFDVGDAYGWTTEVREGIRKVIDSGDANVASIIASLKPSVEEKISATMELIKSH